MCDLCVNRASSKAFILIVIEFWLLPLNFLSGHFLQTATRLPWGMPGEPPSCSSSNVELIYGWMLPQSGTKTSIIPHHSSE